MHLQVFHIRSSLALLYSLMSSKLYVSYIFISLQGGRVQTRVGILMLLATWMADCPTAVAHFLFNTANVPYVSFLS